MLRWPGRRRPAPQSQVNLRTYQFAAGYCCANATNSAYPLTALRTGLREQPLFQPGAITCWERWPGGVLAVFIAVTVPLDVDERDAGLLLAEAIHSHDDARLTWLVPARDARLAGAA